VGVQELPHGSLVGSNAEAREGGSLGYLPGLCTKTSIFLRRISLP
jgi:hypothetical protein